jgi:predicted ribosomally synthesized peptide with SipW-like signal peptide
MSLMFGATLALFSDNTTVKTHLTAGDLEADLWRTNLEYTSLSSEGLIEKTVVEDDLDMTNTTITEANVFGLDSEKIVIIPGSYIKADMEIRNAGNVAFDYVVKLIFTGDNTKTNAFAKQLKITITDADGNTSEPLTLDKFTLSGEDYVILKGSLNVSTVEGVISSDTFSVTVEFVDDDSSNNLAQAATATFDLIVESVQSSK